MKFFRTWVEEPDLKRRSFIFGAAATLIVPPPKSFFIIEPPKLITEIDPSILKFDLPKQQMIDLLKRLEEKMIEVSAIPRWVVVNKDDYDMLVGGTHGQGERVQGVREVGLRQGKEGREGRFESRPYARQEANGAGWLQARRARQAG
jgi:hypothetical protein